MSVELLGLGLLIGVLLAVTGAGGAILSVPLLVFFTHLSLSEAAPISLFALALAASFGAALGLKAHQVRYKAAGLMAAFGIGMAPIGAWLSHIIPTNWLGIAFALLLAYVGLRIWQSSRKAASILNTNPPACQMNAVTSRLFWTAACTLRLGLAGASAGLLSGLLGVGGGFVIVPALHRVSNFDQPTVIATSITVIALVSCAGFASYALHGGVNWPLALTFGMSTLVGLLVGKQFAITIAQHISQRLFAALAVLTSMMLLAKYLA